MYTYIRISWYVHIFIRIEISYPTQQKFINNNFPVPLKALEWVPDVIHFLE